MVFAQISHRLLFTLTLALSLAGRGNIAPSPLWGEGWGEGEIAAHKNDITLTLALSLAGRGNIAPSPL